MLKYRRTSSPGACSMAQEMPKSSKNGQATSNTHIPRPRVVAFAEPLPDSNSWPSTSLLTVPSDRSGNQTWSGAQADRLGRQLPVSASSAFNTVQAQHSNAARASLRSKGSSKLSQLFVKQEKVDLKTRLAFYESAMPDVDVQAFPSVALKGFTTTKLESHWTMIVKDCQSLSHREVEQQSALWELIETEAAYLQQLRNILEYLAIFLELQNEGYFPGLEPGLAFGNIVEIYGANNSFWQETLAPVLDDARLSLQPLNPLLMAPGFNQIARIFLPYIRFSLMHQNIVNYVSRKQKEVEELQDFITWIEAHKGAKRSQFLDLLLRPLQRLTKYPLLLKVILKCSEETETTITGELLQMLQKTESFLSCINYELNYKQHFDSLLSIMAMIDSYEAVEFATVQLSKMVKRYSRLDLTSPMVGCHPRILRSLFIQGFMKLKDSFSKADVYCFLFTDLFLVCKPSSKKGEQLRLKIVKQPFHIDRILIHDLSDWQGFAFVYFTEFGLPSCAFTVSTPSPQESHQWLDAFRIAKETYISHKEQMLLLGRLNTIPETVSKSKADENSFAQATAHEAGKTNSITGFGTLNESVHHRRSGSSPSRFNYDVTRTEGSGECGDHHSIASDGHSPRRSSSDPKPVNRIKYSSRSSNTDSCPNLRLSSLLDSSPNRESDTEVSSSTTGPSITLNASDFSRFGATSRPTLDHHGNDLLGPIDVDISHPIITPQCSVSPFVQHTSPAPVNLARPSRLNQSHHPYSSSPRSVERQFRNDVTIIDTHVERICQDLEAAALEKIHTQLATRSPEATTGFGKTVMERPYLDTIPEDLRSSFRRSRDEETLSNAVSNTINGPYPTAIVRMSSGCVTHIERLPSHREPPPSAITVAKSPRPANDSEAMTSDNDLQQSRIQQKLVLQVAYTPSTECFLKEIADTPQQQKQKNTSSTSNETGTENWNLIDFSDENGSTNGPGSGGTGALADGSDGYSPRPGSGEQYPLQRVTLLRSIGRVLRTGGRPRRPDSTYGVSGTPGLRPEKSSSPKPSFF